MTHLAKNGSVNELLLEIAFENPRPAERWFARYDFDPCHGKTQLRAAARKGLIELDTSDPNGNWRFRFTSKGRDFYDKLVVASSEASP